ncbi:hypothetical protein KIN20_015920 [Parelaphostrongylus tenuis]|uniref:Uncharacterized protein n=1 Tax=Parelaphostrongylus tenuis TaxID=148309 RepID=A0AAD5N1E5_PARTN|nr:hypothetical protein KIN20_015920 [Parelaphostrongylus tenuis]
MAKLPIDSLMIILLATISTAFGCGVMPAGQNDDMLSRCIIIGNTVAGICNKSMKTKKCMEKDKAEITPVPANHTSISGTLTTSNIIMASWSRTMWQNVLNRALRILALGPFKSHFFSAFGTVGGS